METSLRYGENWSSLRRKYPTTSLRIHAKEKFAIDSSTILQVQGELDTQVGSPDYCAVIARQFYPEFSANIGVGMQYFKQEKFGYTVRAKKTFHITTNGLFTFNVKGRCDSDKDFNKRNGRGAAELSWSMFNFNKDQDVRLRVGYEFVNKVPYVQIRENNWTLNADIKGRWNVRFDL